ncbi:MAG TPA: hypothetical protein VF190_13470 [Rhodothermales bacterium]
MEAAVDRTAGAGRVERFATDFDFGFRAGAFRLPAVVADFFLIGVAAFLRGAEAFFSSGAVARADVAFREVVDLRTGLSFFDADFCERAIWYRRAEGRGESRRPESDRPVRWGCGRKV